MNLIAEVNNLIDTHQTRDPFTIASCEGINVIYEEFDSTFGFFLLHEFEDTYKTIVLNSNLEGFMKDFVMAHELGHAILHSDKKTLKYDKGIYFLDDDDFFGCNTIREHQANRFALHLLKNRLRVEDPPEEIARYVMKYFKL